MRDSTMQYRRLGRTGLEVSVISLGSGGPNRFGQSRYASSSKIRELVAAALEMGVNFFDTAAEYEESEALLRTSLRGVPRDRYILATKVFPGNGEDCITPEKLVRQVEKSLVRLDVETIDLLQLHRVHSGHYKKTVETLLPAMETLRSQGKVRFLGITESSGFDPSHLMLREALGNNVFDTVMVAYHPGNPAAAETVFPLARENDVGVIGMAAARHLVPRSLAQRTVLFARALASLVTAPPRRDKAVKRLLGIPATLRPGLAGKSVRVQRDHDAGELVLPEAAYTFATSHPAVSTVLTGTIDIAHLESNARAALAPPLTESEIERMSAILAQN